MATQHKATALKIIYTIFLGLIIALFYGLGISAFYESPKKPETPVVLMEAPVGKDCSQSTEQREEQKKFDNEQKGYQNKFSEYSRNVSIIALGLAVLTLIISLIFLDKILILSDGMMLGGVFTLLYSIIRGFMAEDASYRFIVVSVGLVITLILGYVKFIRHEEKI